MWPFAPNLSKALRPRPLHEVRRQLRLLVIDDDPNAFPTEILRQEGYNIVEWRRVERISDIERGDYDIVVLDIGGVALHLTEVTNQDGLGVLDHLKRNNPAQIIIAFSGNQFDIAKNEFFTKANAVLAKPVDALKCKETLDAVIQREFTPERLWERVEQGLRDDGVSESKIQGIERQVLGRIRKGKEFDATGALTRLIEGTEKIERLSGLIVKLVAVATAL
jgi:CheY-like chemotaxis protein